MSHFRADLHCHSTCSDGTATPQELLQLAKASELQGLAITDHDSIAAYKGLLPLANELGIELISGVEFSTVHEGESVHLLGYSFALADEAIDRFCQRHQERRTNRNRAILQKLTQQGMQVSEEEIAADGDASAMHSIGRVHIALAMVEKGYVTSINDAFKRFLGEGKSCYAPGDSLSAQETIDLIHASGGFAIIAHPHLIDNGRLVKKLMQLNFDGLEGYYANFNPDKNEPWLKLAQEKGWLVTGGSDFHGTIKPSISLGASWAPEETFRLLKQRHLENNKNFIA